MHHTYGGPEALKCLVDACRRRDLAVILDVVYNHLGPAGNYVGRFGPYFTDRYATPWGQAVNLDAQWCDDFHHALHTVLTGERDGYYADFGSLADLTRALNHAFVYDGRYSAFRRRPYGRPTTGLSGHRFVGFLQNHDQIGNRAQGERSNDLMSLGRLKIAMALVCTTPFIPMLFQGEEWGASSPFQYFTDLEDPEPGRAVSEGRRREVAAFSWSPDKVPNAQAIETFQRSQLNWGERRREPHMSLLDWYRRLIQLRRRVPALLDGRFDRMCVTFEEAHWLILERGPVIVACNLARRVQRMPLGMEQSSEVLLTSDPMIEVNASGMALPPESVVILGPSTS
jgi:maltooligosyltrehalose trehalohydrolase